MRVSSMTRVRTTICLLRRRTDVRETTDQAHSVQGGAGKDGGVHEVQRAKGRCLEPVEALYKVSDSLIEHRIEMYAQASTSA